MKLRIQVCRKMNFLRHMEKTRRIVRMNNKYHFSLHIQFENDCDVDELDKQIALQCYKKSFLNDSKGKNKTAKLWYKTNDYTEADTYKLLKKFIFDMKDKLAIIKNAMHLYSGKATLTLYFEELHDKPFIKLDNDVIKILADNDISFETDFRI